MPSVDQFIVWLVVGLLGGSLAGSRREPGRAGYHLGAGRVWDIFGTWAWVCPAP